MTVVLTESGAELWRKYVTDGNPLSGFHSPELDDIQRWAVEFEAMIATGGFGLAVVTRSLSTPPGSPITGGVYIVGPTPAGDWSLFAEDDIAQWDGAAWTNRTPAGAPLAYIVDEDAVVIYDGTGWNAAGINSLAGLGNVLGGGQFHLINGKVTESHSGNAATFAVKGLDGNNPSVSNPVLAIFPNGQQRTLTAALTVTVSSGSTLGASNDVAFNVWLALVDDAGTLRLAVRNCSDANGVYPFPNNGVLSSTAEGGAGAADSAGVAYTGTAVTSKQCIVIACAQYDSGLAAAGTWNASPSRIFHVGPGTKLPGDLLGRMRVDQIASTTSGVNTTPTALTGFAPTMTLQHAANLVSLRADIHGASASGVVTGLVRWRRGTSTDIGNVAYQTSPATSYHEQFCAFALDKPNATSQAYNLYATATTGSMNFGDASGVGSYELVEIQG